MRTWFFGENTFQNSTKEAKYHQEQRTVVKNEMWLSKAIYVKKAVPSHNTYKYANKKAGFHL